MNNEIKEILQKIQNVVNHKEASYNALVETKAEDYKIFLDYITNLQKTNKNHSKKLIELGNKINNLQQEKDNLYLDNTMLKMEKDIYKIGYEELKELIEKAIMEVKND